MSKPAILGNIFEGVKEELKESSMAAIEQIGVASKKQTPKKPPAQSSDDKKAFLEGLYGEGKQLSPQERTEQELEDKKKEQQLKQLLHGQYYQDLVNPPKPQEERPAEKVEKEKQQERWELEEKKAKKPPPLPFSARGQRGTAELPKAVSG